MSQQSTPPSIPPLAPPQAPSSPLPPAPRKVRFARVRGWLRSRAGRIVVPIVALMLGIALGMLALLLYGITGEGQLLVVPAGKGDIIVEADRTFLTQIVKINMNSAGMPGTIQNVDVTLAQGDQLTINGDDAFSLLGIGVTKHFVVVVQPYISSCVVQIHVVHADLDGIPVTGFAPAFESQINRQLAQQPSGLPKGFRYCAAAVRTQPAAMFVTYSATPLATDGALARQRWV
jgi:hypothetical protein